MASQRSRRITSKSKQKEYYSDFMMDFDLNPITGSLELSTNADAVKRSIENLVQTQRGERPYNLNIGSEVRRSLFNPFDEITASAIQESIVHTINQFERRAQNVNIKIRPDIEHNSYEVDISFSVINIPTIVQQMTLILSRVR